MKQKQLRFILLMLIVVLLCISQCYGMTSESIINKLPPATQNNRIDLENPFAQGNFGYNYPIEVPAGINGLEPTLALVYNSESQQEKAVGFGWELTGDNRIRRNNREGMPWFDDQRDSFILTLNGKEYVIHSDKTFENATLKADYSGNTWTVYQNDGTVFTFIPAVNGNSATGTSMVSLWILSEERDANGNTLNYTYDTSYVNADGVVYLTKITYNDSIGKQKTINFTYQSAVSLGFSEWPTNADDPTYTCWQGHKECYKLKLTNISTGEQSYTFQYKLSKCSRHALLASITPGSGDPVTLTYQSDAYAETSGWTWTDKWSLSQTGLGGYLEGDSITSQKDFDILSRDFNNDGWLDLMVQKHRSYYCVTTNVNKVGLQVADETIYDLDYAPQIYLNNKEGGWQSAGDLDTAAGQTYFGSNYRTIGEAAPFPAYLDYYYSNHWYQVSAPRLFDLNGDGLIDLIMTYKYTGAAMFKDPYGYDYEVSRLKNKDIYHAVFYNDGQGNFIYQPSVSTVEAYNAKITTIPGYLDFDGDGLADPFPAQFLKSTLAPYLADINGDRLPDLYKSGYQLNQGDGNFVKVSTSTNPNFTACYQFLYGRRIRVDLNNDGVYETLSFDFPNRKLNCTAEPRYEITLPEESRYCRPLLNPDHDGLVVTNYIYEMFVDVNNDGYPDLLSVNGSYLNNAKPDFLTQISGPETIGIGYKRIPVATQFGDDSGRKGATLYRWAVDRITSDNQTSTFSYTGGLHDLVRREFRGYHQISVAGPDETTAYSYDPTDRRMAGLVQKVSGPEGEVVYDYQFTKSDSSWNIAKLTIASTPANSPETVTENEYDADGNLITQTQTFSYNGISNTTTRRYEYSKNSDKHIANALKYSSESDDSGLPAKENHYYYDNLETGEVTTGNLTCIKTVVKPSESGSEDLTVNIEYDTHGVANKIKDADGNATVTELVPVDDHFIKRVTTNAKGHQTIEIINIQTGLTSQSIDANKAVTSYSYYPDRRLKRVTYPNGGFTDYQYQKTETGDITITRSKVGSKNGAILQWHEERQDKAGNLVLTLDKQVSATDPDGAGPYTDLGQPVLSAKSYNDRGQVVKESLSYFEGDQPAWVSYEYEENNSKHRLLKAIRPDGKYTAYAYDDPNQKVTVTDYKGNKTTTAESYQKVSLEGLGNIPCRVVTVTDAIGAVRSYYSLDGQLLQEVDASGNKKAYKYDSLGRVYYSRDLYKGTVTYQYNRNGLLAAKTDAKGQTVTLGYDELNRLTSKTYPSGRKVQWLYDQTTADDPVNTNGIGRLGAYIDGSGTTRLGYDVSGDLTRKKQGDYQLSFTYDTVSRLTGITYPQNYQVNYTYDQGGLAQVSADGKILAAYSNRDASGAAKQIQLANGVQNVMDYNPDTGALAKLASIKSGLNLLDFVYSYDANGNVVSITDQTPIRSGHPAQLNESFGYDSRNRLMSAIGVYGDCSYAYDQVGNMTLKEGVDYGYGATGQPYALVTGSNGYAAKYDANGNMVEKVDGSSKHNHYILSYDEDNQLTRITKNDNYTEEFTYDATGYRVKKTVTGGAATDYVYLGNTLLYEITSGKGVNYVWAEGKLIAKVEESVGKTTYYTTDHLGSGKLQTDDDGNVISTDSVLPYGPSSGSSVFTGKTVEEDIGLIYFGARWYDPEVGRFITVDPAEDGGNWYGYCGGNPVNAFDPDGRISFLFYLLGFVVGGSSSSPDCNLEQYLNNGISGVFLFSMAGEMYESYRLYKFFNTPISYKETDKLNIETAYHAVPTPEIGRSVLKGIDPKRLNSDSRFGPGFYMSQESGTTIKELAYHGKNASNVIRFKVDLSNKRVLNLANPKVAREWGFSTKGSVGNCQSIGMKAKNLGFDVIVFPSYRGAGVNLVILKDFEKIIKPVMNSPANLYKLK